MYTYIGPKANKATRYFLRAQAKAKQRKSSDNAASEDRLSD